MVADEDAQLARAVDDADLDLLAVADAVGDQVVDGALQHGGLGGVGAVSAAGEEHLVAGIGPVGGDAVEQGIDVDGVALARFAQVGKEVQR